MIHANEIANKNLHPTEQCLLLLALNLVEKGGTVTVCLQAPKVGDTSPRIADQDYVGLPGVSSDVQIGSLSVHRYVDNPQNRREDRVGGVHLKVMSVTRANGLRPYGWTGVRPADITAFKVLGIDTRSKEEMATVELARAIDAREKREAKAAEQGA